MGTITKPKPRPVTKPKTATMMIATAFYFGPDHLQVTEGTIVAGNHPEPKARPGLWKPVTPTE